MTSHVGMGPNCKTCIALLCYPVRQRRLITSQGCQYATAQLDYRFSVPKVIFLQAAEFSGSQVRLKNYENGHKNIFGLSVVLELKVENSKILTFKVIFLFE